VRSWYGYFTKIYSKNNDKYLLDCPCHENCPDGCPCPNYECKGAASILVINSASSSENAVLFEWGSHYERLNEDIPFTYGSGTQSYYSCSFTLNNEMYIVGGLNYNTQGQG